jgi:putative ABC transport system permease protein
VLNRTITLDGNNYLVTGVMPPGTYPSWPTTSGKISFDPNQQQYWIPLSFSAERARARNSHVIGVLGRMKPGVTIDQARAEMNTIAARLEQEYPVNKGIGIIVEPFLTEMVGNVRPALMMLVGAVGLVLLIACANIAGLLMAQHSGRRKEIAIRAALGAGRSRLMRQFVIEGLLLSVMGSVAGVLLALVGVNLILKLIPSQFPRFDQTTLDFRVLGFTLALSFATCLLFAIVPAWHAARTNLHATLEQGGRSSNAGVKQRFRQVLVIGQVGLAMMLLIGAGLLIKTFWRLRNVDPGFEPEHVISLAISLPASKYPSGREINTFYNQLNGQLTNLPGVQVAAIGYDHPLEANWGDAFTIAGRPEPPAGQWPVANFNPLSPEYFHAVGTPVVSGRQFTSQDDENHPGVLIVNEAFVHKYFPGQNVLGQHLNLNQPARLLQNPTFTSFEIVGVARNVKSAGLTAESEPAYYVPATQAPIPDMTVLVRAKGDPAPLVPALRGAVWAVDPNQPVAHVNTMEQIVSDSIAQPRLSMILMTLFGGLAMILSVVGIYGLLSYSVSQRTQEMGIRLALGAQVADVLRLVLRQGLVLILAGEVLGFVGAWALTRLIGSLLFGVRPTDPATFIAVAGTLAIVGTLGCYIPARRATKVDPLIALRYE